VKIKFKKFILKSSNNFLNIKFILKKLNLYKFNINNLIFFYNTVDKNIFLLKKRDLVNKKNFNNIIYPFFFLIKKKCQIFFFD
jgi:hypothetical protein